MADLATDDELQQYDAMFIATSNALGDALRILKRLEATTLDPSAKDKITDERRGVEDRIAQVDRDMIAFFAGDLALRPPSAAMVSAVTKTARELALLTQQATNLQAVMKLTKFVVDKYKSLS
jgi:hypothetical protein